MKVLLLLLWLPVGSVRAQVFSEEVVRATYKLFNKKSTATGFVLEAEDGRKFLVSAAHVFEKMDGETVAQACVIRETLQLAIGNAGKADSAGAEDGKEKQEGGG